MTIKNEDTDTNEVTLPTNGRKTLTEQGKSLREVLDEAPQPEALKPENIDWANPAEVVRTDTGSSAVVPPAPPVRELVLEDASDLMTKRETDTESVTAVLEQTADLWSALFGFEVEPEKVTLALGLHDVAVLNANSRQPEVWAHLVANGALGGELSS